MFRFRIWLCWLLIGLIIVPLANQPQAQELQAIKLNIPDKTRGLPVMAALSVRASVREWSEKELDLQSLSDLLWAANGVNRPESKKRTAASAMNSQDVDIYVFTKDGVYLYDAFEHALNPVIAGDHRAEIAMARRGRPEGPAGPGSPAAPKEGQPPAKPDVGLSKKSEVQSVEGKGSRPAKPDGEPMPRPDTPPSGPPPGPPSSAPIQLVLVSDISRFGAGTPELKKEWAAIDVGIVSQNIALFCAGTGLATRPRASVDREKLKVLLKLKDTQIPFLDHPVGYPK